jgi:hypothetical protein
VYWDKLFNILIILEWKKEKWSCNFFKNEIDYYYYYYFFFCGWKITIQGTTCPTTLRIALHNFYLGFSLSPSIVVLDRPPPPKLDLPWVFVGRLDILNMDFRAIGEYIKFNNFFFSLCTKSANAAWCVFPDYLKSWRSWWGRLLWIFQLLSCCEV